MARVLVRRSERCGVAGHDDFPVIENADA